MSGSPDTSIVRVGAGVSLRVEIQGSGPPAVVLHGFTGDASTMAPIAEPLGTTHRVVIPNLIGHGGSTGPTREDYSVDAMAEQVVEALDQMQVVGLVDLVGYSMGGRVALTIACRFPTRVRSLSLIGASAGLATAGERDERVAADEALAASIESDGLEAFVDRWMANPLFATQQRLGDETIAGFRHQRMQNDPDELVLSLRGAGTGRMRPLHELLPTCFVPTLFVAGADDPKFTAIADDLASRMPDADVVVIDGAGHAAHLENPEGVGTAIAGWVRRASVATWLNEVPLVAPLTTGRGTTTVRRTQLLALRSDGHEGWGEAAPMPGWSVDTLDESVAALAAVRDSSTTILATPAGAGDLWERSRAVLDALVACPSARAAMAGAVLDLEARQLGLPLHELLRRRFEVADERGDEDISMHLHALVSDPDPAVVAREVTALAAAGFSTVKLKVAAVEPDVDIARIAAARGASPTTTLRLDANGGWDPQTAREVLGRAAAFDVALCEEPVAGLDRIISLGRDSPVPLAVDESARGTADLERLWARPAGTVAAVVIKPQALGGPDRALAAIDRARAVGLDVIVTTMIDSAVGVAHAAHVAAAARLPGPHGLATSALLGEDVADAASALPVNDGSMRFAAADDPARWGSGIGIGAVSPCLARPS